MPNRSPCPAALAQEPRLLVLDEPTVGLDLHTRGELVALVNRAQDLGCTVLVASHDRDLLTIADHHLDLAAHVTPPIGSDADNAPLTSTPATPSTRILPVRAGRAVPTDRLNPLTMCVLAVAAAVGSAGVTTWQVGLPALAVTLGMLPLTMRNIRGAALRLLPVTIAALGLWWSTMLASPGPTFSGDSFLLGFKEALRILYFVAPGVLLLTSLDPTALGDALGGRLRLPGRPVATAVSGLVRAGLTAETFDRIRAARRLRGLGGRWELRHPIASVTSQVRVLSSCSLALLVDAFRSADQQALAMDSRGFATAQHRTWALPSPFSRADVVGAGGVLVLLVLPTLIGRSLG
jgi:energy-coupling factor transport system ATP-binding protein